MKKFLRKHAESIYPFLGALAILLVVILGLGGVIAVEASTPITTEEYRVLTVYQYSAPITNGYGGVKRHETKYHVTYTDNDGNIYEKEMRNSATTDEKPYEAVYMSNETKFVVENKGSTNWYSLYLTEKDFECMQYKIINTK